MSNKKQTKSKKDIEAEEIERVKTLEENYKEYIENMQNRLESGELLEVKEFAQWKRNVTKNRDDGSEVTIEVSGDTGETKNQKFTRLAKARMIKCLDDLSLLINLSSPQYEPHSEQVEKMLNALKLKVQDIEKSFAAQKKDKSSFEF